MEYIKERNDIVEVGRELLLTGLVARTWGNISAREDKDNFLITPSGLDYVTMTDSDIVEVNITTGEWKGNHKPSGERGVHKAAYQVFDDVNFVVHTHQTYATAIGLSGIDDLDISNDEKDRLGGIALAAYGLPGSDKLTNAVTEALKSGAHIVLMLHHGVLICGASKEDAMERARLLEEVCKRNIKGQASSKDVELTVDQSKASKVKEQLEKKYSHVAVVSTKELLQVAGKGKNIIAQLDDISQMVGVRIKVVKEADIEKAFKKTNAVLVKGLGAVVRADNKDDEEALSVLLQKMAVVKLHTEAFNLKATISIYESMLMHYNYVTNYSKQKK